MLAQLTDEELGDSAERIEIKSLAGGGTNISVLQVAFVTIHSLAVRGSVAEEIAAAAVFLASDHARSINGDTIVIDGG